MPDSRSNAIALGLAIEQRRKEFGYSRPELARISTLSYPYIYEIEKGRKDATYQALEKVAGVLDVTPEWLMDRGKELEPQLDRLLVDGEAAETTPKRPAANEPTGIDRIVADVMKQLEPIVRSAVEREMRDQQ